MRLRIAGLLAAAAFTVALAAPAVAQASTAQPASGVVIRDGNGADLGIVNGAHGASVGTGGSEAFLEVGVSGGSFELEGQTNAQCLTVDASASDIVKWESCSGASSTLWTRSGLLYRSVLTGEPMFASPEGSCSATGAVSSKGGEPENCSNEWNNA